MGNTLLVSCDTDVILTTFVNPKYYRRITLLSVALAGCLLVSVCGSGIALVFYDRALIDLAKLHANASANASNAANSSFSLEGPPRWSQIITGAVGTWQRCCNCSLLFVVCILVYLLTTALQSGSDLLSKPEIDPDRIRSVTHLYQDLEEQLSSLNEIFSYVNLIWCAYEIITVIYFIAAFLQPPVGELTYATEYEILQERL